MRNLSSILWASLLGWALTLLGGPQREDTVSLNVRIKFPGDTRFTDLGIWDKKTGGDLDSNDTSYFPGAMADRISLGGRRNPSNVVVSRLYRLQRDHDIVQRYLNSVGRSQIILSEQPLDIEENAYGKPLVYSGIVKRVTPPPRDSESSNAAMIEIEFVVTGSPTS